MATLLTHTEVPFVRPDGGGYVLGGEAFEGFDDRPDLGVPVRLRIARMAQAYSPEDLTDAQKALLKAGSPKKVDVDLLQAIADDEALLSGPVLSGLRGLLSDEQRKLAADPSSHPKLDGATYPLRIEQAAKLVGVTHKQLQYWDKKRIVRAYRVGGQRQYFRGMVLLAMAVKKLDAVEKSFLPKLLAGQASPVLLIAAASSATAGQESASKLFEEFSNASVVLGTALSDSCVIGEVRVIPHGGKWEVVEFTAAPRSLGIFGMKKAKETARNAAEKVGAGRFEILSADGSVERTEKVFA